MDREHAGIISTVTGDLSAASLGVTLPHEHLIHQASIHSHNPDNTCIDVDLVAEEVAAFRRRGGRAICDVTPIGIGRDPHALQRVSRQSGVIVVSGVGLYQTDVLPHEVRGLSRDKLADYLVREANGEPSGIAAGLIGEIASHNEPHSDWTRYRLTEDERRVFQATADAQRRTGLCISTHASLGRQGVAQLRVLIGAGADPERVVIGHCDAQMHTDAEQDLRYYQAILNEGASVGFDLFGWEELASDADRCQRVAALVGAGYTDRILLSTDTCRLSHLHRFGGRGFDYLFTSVIPGLREAGVTDEQIGRMTTANPARLLSRVAV